MKKLITILFAIAITFVANAQTYIWHFANVQSSGYTYTTNEDVACLANATEKITIHAATDGGTAVTLTNNTGRTGSSFSYYFDVLKLSRYVGLKGSGSPETATSYKPTQRYIGVPISKGDSIIFYGFAETATKMSRLIISDGLQLIMDTISTNLTPSGTLTPYTFKYTGTQDSIYMYAADQNGFAIHAIFLIKEQNLNTPVASTLGTTAVIEESDLNTLKINFTPQIRFRDTSRRPTEGYSVYVNGDRVEVQSVTSDRDTYQIKLGLPVGSVKKGDVVGLSINGPLVDAIYNSATTSPTGARSDLLCEVNLNVTVPINAFTAILDPGTGTCASASETETAESAGITLPAASPSAKCGVAGYTFAGWAGSSVAETNLMPDMLQAGAWAIPQDTTLYAVYTDGNIYDSNPICKVSLNGVVTEGWLMIEDFENAEVGTTTYTLYRRYEGVGATVPVVADPASDGEHEKVIHVSTTNWDQYLELTVTLPCNRTLADYSHIGFDIYRASDNNNDFIVAIDKTVVSNEDGNYDIKETNFNVGAAWVSKELAFPADQISGNTFTLRIGYRTNAGNFYLDNIKLKEKDGLAACTPYTITLDPGAGTCDETSLTEVSAGAGITLPVPSLSAQCVSAGWEFEGWAESTSAEGTTIAPTLYSEASTGTYYPAAGGTLYAVYTDGTYYETNPDCGSMSGLKAANAAGCFIENGILYVAQNADIQIYTPNGIIVKSAENASFISISELSTGIYIAKINVNGEVFIEKVVKR